MGNKENFDCNNRVETLKVKKVEYSLLAYHRIQTNERCQQTFRGLYKSTAFLMWLHPHIFENCKTI